MSSGISSRKSETVVSNDLNVEDYIDPQRVFRESEYDLAVAIRYARRIVRWIQEGYGKEVTLHPDGSATIEHRCKSPWWAVGCALGYGDAARIDDNGVAQVIRDTLTLILDEGS